MRLLFLIALIVPMMTSAQTYTSLWKQVSDAEANDLPQTEQEVLRQISAKASAENNYGQLLKAELQYSRSQGAVSPDSLHPAVERLKLQASQASGDVPLLAVYHCVLGYIYQNNSILDSDHHLETAADFYAKALAHPDKLAAVKATDYEPFVIKGQDSRFFADDLLNIIGREASRYDLLHSYYVQAGNRRAALLTGCWMLKDEEPEGMEPLNKSRHLQRIDSLISVYQDLTECGEAAIMRYEFMEDHTDATAEQKWQYINMALEKWGAWQRMNVLRNAQRALSAMQYNADLKDKVAIPHRSQTVLFTGMRSISEVTMRVYRANVEGNTELNPEYSGDYKKLKPLLTPLEQMAQTLKFVGKRPYELFEDSMTLEGLPTGVYMLEFESVPATQVTRTLYYVSDLRVLAQSLPADKVRLAAVNATTGQPAKGAKIAVTWGYGGDRKTAAVDTDQNGECTYDITDKPNISLRAVNATDKACPNMGIWGNFSYSSRDDAQTYTAIYTDRAIYRPGQTVHAAAIVYNTKDRRQHSVVAGKEVTFSLYDANWKKVGEKSITTDDYGTATAGFILPSKGLTGLYSVYVNGSSHSIRVEEYKRPTFEVDIPRVAQNYEDGDTVVAKGTVRSYAGVPVQGAKVKYTVRRTRAWWWMGYSRYWSTVYAGTATDDELMAQGETVTDANGHFTVDMPMVLPMSLRPLFYNFVLTADVTDQGGETHQGQMTLPLGNRKTAFSVTLPEKVLGEAKVRMAFHQQNVAGVDLDATVRYRFDNGRWLTAKTNSLIDLPQLRSGKHQLHAICESDTLEQDFVVFSLDDHRPATDTRSWFYTSRSQFPMDGSAVTVQAGSSDKNVHVLYSVFTADRMLESGTAELNNELINRKLLYKEEYGNGVLLTFAWMKEGKTYSYTTTIKRPMPDMNLDVKWTTFRNKLEPGQKEEWTLTITDVEGRAAQAQLMAALYDKSLDQLAHHSWSLAPPVMLPTPYTSWWKPSWGGASCSAFKSASGLSVQPLRLSRFDHDVYPSFDYGLMMLRKRLRIDLLEEAPMPERMLAKAATGGAVEMSNATADMAADEEQSETAEEEKEAADGAQDTKQDKANVRENLQETAFFMPQLVTDEQGVVKIRFTLPESLTTWRFISVAHTKDMKYGTMTDEAVARKDVMIQPNMPRFLRHDDKATISARVINMSDTEVSGTAMMQLLDPETERVVMEQKKQVSVADSSTVAVTFDVDCNTLGQQHSLLVARISIDTPRQNDGEQHYLPLLPTTERITVTRPFTQTAAGTAEIDLKSLLPADAKAGKLTVEYTNNPAWLMIQALPSIAHPYDDCAFCQATSLYANAIGKHIMKQNPTAKNVFEQWKQEKGSETSLVSSLEKDQELKELLLDETPWVMDADRESEQKQRLVEFFELNTIESNISNAIDKLKKLQNGNGSWSWWPGMYGSLTVTTAVTEMLVRLNIMTGKQKDTEKMLKSAFDYLADDIVKLVEDMKKAEKKGVKQVFPTYRALQWLYICEIDGRSLPKKVTDANTYLKNLLKKEIKNQSIYEKALSAIILGNKTYVKSLKEWTTYKEDMGRYYDTQRATYSWRDYKIPTQVAAIEAIKMLTPQDTTTVGEMQRWLLQQKRTQAWDTPLNSVDAVYAFLNGNSTVLAPQKHTALSIDGKPLDTSDATSGLGYVKTALPFGTASEAGSTFTATKSSTGTSWGAIYAQFTQQASMITDHSSGLSVKRELMTEGSDGRLKPAPEALTVGDRVVVRVTIDAERDYDFVQLIEKKAACMEPLKQTSGYDWRGGYYCSPKDQTTCYYFSVLPKGQHVITKEYYIDRAGTYSTGTCTVQCAYSPEFVGNTKALIINVKDK